MTQSDYVPESGRHWANGLTYQSTRSNMSKSVKPDKTEACLAGDTSGETDFSKIDINTKPYIDTACQASSNTIIAAIKSYIDQNNEAHKDMIAKLNETFRLMFQPNSADSLSRHY
ncbi:13486_t:CDS:2 [Racocetra persica]|uniref:13486_t:CDS:1 n=1 Tax=Racocetra persica TaxID=160502 RepID=A0ACA9Q4D9_9GLOM|nr:13486_t:CDS:2 [Racocetra persica]